MIRTEFNTEAGFLDARYEGDIDIKQLVEYIAATEKNRQYPRFLKILSDGTHANMMFAPGDLPLIVEANYKSLKQYDYIVDAIILDSPKETALSQLYLEIAKTNKYKFKVFATREAALQWLENTAPGG